MALKGQDLGLHLSRAVDTYAGGPSVPSQHTGLACCSRPFLWGKAHTRGKWNLIESDLQASTTTTRPQTLTPEGQQCPQSRRKACLVLFTDFRHSGTNCASNQGESARYTFREDAADDHIKTKQKY